MEKHVYRLNELKGRDLLEFRTGTAEQNEKFTRLDSLYVDTGAFYCFLDDILTEMIEDFDMLHDTVISRDQWDHVMKVDLSEIIDSMWAPEAADTLRLIHQWVERNVPPDGSFVVIGLL